MRFLSPTICVLAVTPWLGAADKPDALAKETAIQFLKAVRAKDPAAVMKVCDVPFAYKKEGDVAVHRERADLEAWVKERLEKLNTPDLVPTEIDELLTYDQVVDKIEKPEHKKIAEEITGKNGFLALISVPGGDKGGIVIRIKDGKAKVVGLFH